MNQIGKQLAVLIKKRKGQKNICYQNERAISTEWSLESVRKFYVKVYANKFENLNEKDIFTGYF